jgi:1-acyl-sn-glycerol-3-phosphate acyltransferase
LLDAAFDQIDAELAAGNLVCIFPEGAITHDGEIQSFRPGIEKIITRRKVPVIPIGLGGLWGSWFSRRKTGGLKRIPGRLFARVDVRVGQAVAAGDATAGNLELLVRTLRGQNR